MSSSTDHWVAVGVVGKPHGVRGEVSVRPLSDRPDRITVGSSFEIDDLSLIVRSVRRHGRALLVAFEGFEDRAQAESLRGSELLIPSDDRYELGDDEYWPDDLVGLQVLDEDGVILGIVDDVIIGDSQDRLIIKDDDREFSVPFVEELVPEVQPAQGRLIIKAIPGLIE